MNPQKSITSGEAHHSTKTVFDVTIIGGGFAGATLALHLALHLPEVSVAVVEPNPKPDRFTHKVGESSLGPQGTYLAQWLQLENYLNESHIEKFGTRYFFGDPTGPFAARPEIGARHAVADFPIYEYQVDRGKLEADLRDMVVEKGVTWLSYRVTDVQLGQGSATHTLRLHNRASGEEQKVQARWVIDASGRRRLLHRLRHDRTEQTGRCSAAWFRLPGWIDVDDFVPSTDTTWHERVSPRHPRGIPFGRFNSTNHLCGEGYWVWLIPLPDKVMSVGIVAEAERIPFELYNTEERARNWLTTNEPQLAAIVKEREMLDFRTMRRYSYLVDDFLSAEGWGLTGDALGFSDPFYSPGGDMIGLANLIIVETIRRERKGMIDEETCQQLTENMRHYQALATDAIQAIYPYLGMSRVATAHIVWDFLSIIAPMAIIIRAFSPKLYDYLGSKETRHILAELAAVQADINQLMASWGEESNCQLPPHSIVDHTEKLEQLTGHIWGEVSGKDMSALITYLLDQLKAIADKYHTNGLAWDIFGPL